MRKHLPLLLVVLLLVCSFRATSQHITPVSDDALLHARHLLSSVPLIDGHNDLAWAIREKAAGKVEEIDLLSQPSWDTDLRRLRSGEVGAQFWSVYVPGENKEGNARFQLEQIDIAHRMIERYPEVLMVALRAADVQTAFNRGLIASFLGMEGGHAIENSLGALRAFYSLGVRYMTLTHNVTLDWADAALDKPKHNGLTAFGKEVVREMNRLGMLVDLSHVSDRVMSDALDVSEAPVIFSHSAARALTNHARNVPDSILVRLPKNGGVVMVCFIPSFISQEVAQWEAARARYSSSDTLNQRRNEYVRTHPMPRATLQQVADHIEYIRKLAGIDHVGIGSDFYGDNDVPEGLEDVSKFPYLFAELIKRGWSDADLEKLAGGNILRVLREAETVAARLQKLRPPSTATIEQLDGRTK